MMPIPPERSLEVIVNNQWPNVKPHQFFWACQSGFRVYTQGFKRFPSAFVAALFSKFTDEQGSVMGVTFLEGSLNAEGSSSVSPEELAFFGAKIGGDNCLCDPTTSLQCYGP